MARNIKLEEINKNTILIIKSEYINKSIRSVDDGLYDLVYMPNVIMKYDEYKDKLMVNTKTNETIKYDELRAMKVVGSDIVYLYPNSMHNIFVAHEAYRIDNWLFQGDNRIKNIESGEKMNNIENSNKLISNALSIVKEILELQRDKGLISLPKELATLDKLTQQIQELQEITHGNHQVKSTMAHKVPVDAQYTAPVFTTQLMQQNNPMNSSLEVYQNQTSGWIMK